MFSEQARQYVDALVYATLLREPKFLLATDHGHEHEREQHAQPALPSPTNNLRNLRKSLRTKLFSGAGAAAATSATPGLFQETEIEDDRVRVGCGSMQEKMKTPPKGSGTASGATQSPLDRELARADALIADVLGAEHARDKADVGDERVGAEADADPWIACNVDDYESYAARKS